MSPLRERLKANKVQGQTSSQENNEGQRSPLLSNPKEQDIRWVYSITLNKIVIKEIRYMYYIPFSRVIILG